MDSVATCSRPIPWADSLNCGLQRVVFREEEKHDVQANMLGAIVCVVLRELRIDVPSVRNRQVEQPKECRFSPYQNNGGTCLAIAGKDFCIVAADSRLSMGYSILSRTTPKVAQLTTKCCIASSGCQADMITLQKFLKFRMQVSFFSLFWGKAGGESFEAAGLASVGTKSAGHAIFEIEAEARAGET